MADPSRSLLLPSARPESLARKYCELADQPDGKVPGLLVCWPSAQMNKYQALLYSQGENHGFAIERISKLEELDEIYWPGPVIFHAHWFGPLAKNTGSKAAYVLNIEEAFERFAEFRTRTGAKFVWTAHNLLPHGSEHPETDAELRRRVLREFDLVHLMEAEHRELLIDSFGVEPKSDVVTPHPHYRGAHIDEITRSGARDRIGFSPAHTIIVFFGSIQRYKGLHGLLDDFSVLQKGSRPDVRLVIAGFPSDQELVAEIIERTRDTEAIRFYPNKVPDENLQILFRAADAAVLPYSGDQLNSGAAFMALSFECPIIAPNEAAFQTFAENGAILYDPEKETGLRDAIASIRPFGQQLDLDTFWARHDPSAVSNAFFDAVGSLIEADRT